MSGSKHRHSDLISIKKDKSGHWEIFFSLSLDIGSSSDNDNVQKIWEPLPCYIALVPCLCYRGICEEGKKEARLAGRNGRTWVEGGRGEGRSELVQYDLVKSWQHWLFPMVGVLTWVWGGSSGSCFARTSSLGFPEGTIQASPEGLLTYEDTSPSPKVILESRPQRVFCHPERRMKMKRGTWRPPTSIPGKENGDPATRCLFWEHDGLNCVSLKFKCWSCNPNVSVFGDRDFKEEIRGKWDRKGEAPI